jgi:hypothetical protein
MDSPLPNRPLPPLLAALLSLAPLGACHGTLEIGLSPPAGDDGAGDDDMSDDDDGSPDDDDGGDDDATVDDDDDDGGIPDDFAGVTGYFLVLGSVHHPQGRQSSGFGYWFAEADSSGPGGGGPAAARDSEPARGIRPPLQPHPFTGTLVPWGSAARGGDFGCDLQVPDAGTPAATGAAARGADYVTLDGGAEATLSRQDANGAWLLSMDRQTDGQDVWYWADPSWSPPSVPPDALLDFSSGGGADLPEISIDSALPTHGLWEVDQPSLGPDAEILFAAIDDGLLFQWEPQGEAGLEIVVAFWDEQSGLSWNANCWVEDSGEFRVDPDVLGQMPAGVTGLTWIRRYVDAWHEISVDNPDSYLQGALQHRWFLSLVGTMDTDPAEHAAL